MVATSLVEIPWTDWGTAGIFAIFALLVLNKVLDFVKTKKNGHVVEKALSAERGAKSIQQIEELWYWHKPDNKGEQPWRNSRMIDILERNTKAIETNTEVCRQLTQMQGECRRHTVELRNLIESKDDAA